MEKLEPIKYGLKSIETTNFVIKNPTQKIESLKKLEIDFDVNPVVKYNIAQDCILILVEIKGLIKETQEEILHIKTAFVYHAIDLKKYMEEIEKTNVWKFLDSRNNALLVTLIGVSLSTMRGILFEKTRGTILEKFNLPIMNPSDFVKLKD
jgi:hypothetical protein